MNLGFLVTRARPFLRDLILISAMSVLASTATLAIPWLAGQFLAGVIGDASVDLSTTIALLVTALAVLTAISILVQYLSAAAAGRILARLRQETYDRLQAMPIAFHDRSKSGDLLSLMTYEVSNLSGFLTATLANVPSILLTAAGAVLLLFLLDPVMALVVPVLVALFYLLMKLVGRRLRTVARKVRKAESDVMWIGESDLEMLPAIKAFATEDFQRRRYHQAVEKARVLFLDQTRMMAFISPLVALVAALGAIAILLLGSAQLADGSRSPSDLFAFLLYAALLTRPVGQLADTYGRFQVAKGTLARLEAVFAKKIEPGYGEPGIIDRAAGAIAFEGVSFAYPGRPAVLTSVNLAIAPGEIVALTGDNGVGKSTLVRLLLRFYDPDGGRITLDGVDIAGLQVQHLRRQFGYVPQRPLLFNGTIADNIAFGNDNPDPAAIERAVQLAQAGEFIAQLPRGLATEIGDNGIRLSGGQQQRLALARALFRDPPVYIFDEATSMYDLDGEAAFVETCIDVLKGRTVIIITHRPASLALADRIIHATPEGLVSGPPAAHP
ncbi:ABC transporter ATP-binding protein [Porphyrobacter sp. ULC335]|uniref:ABC transporter ATP-binding protein n=1 Tax=Porphyrobacter sp. ULC335 TaxID=2854260 RepID=UPI00221F171E|nr:ABC transporter ATP-binding protein [Porphyrobacter sp. ULC335]UYV15871.1 ABC transporter ATP-binding protein/permease [Porphyrobacter sp. ULC335]